MGLEDEPKQARIATNVTENGRFPRQELSQAVRREGSRDWIGLARGIYTPLDTFNKFLSSSFESSSRALKYPRHAMDGISWTDLDKDEQRTIAMLAEGVSTELCDPVALLTLKRIGFIKGSRLTLQAEQMLAAAVRRTFAA